MWRGDVGGLVTWLWLFLWHKWRDSNLCVTLDIISEVCVRQTVVKSVLWPFLLDSYCAITVVIHRVVSVLLCDRLTRYDSDLHWLMWQTLIPQMWLCRLRWWLDPRPTSELCNARYLCDSICYDIEWCLASCVPCIKFALSPVLLHLTDWRVPTPELVCMTRYASPTILRDRSKMSSVRSSKLSKCFLPTVFATRENRC